MTDISPTNPHIEPLLAPGSHFSPHVGLSNGLSTVETVIEEDDSIIRCICGFPDDDGNTVLCEECNTWQHIDCYYPTQDVPDIHHCTKCRPRSIDAKAAADRQRLARTGTIPGDKKTKRPQARSHKKKTKDPLTTSSAKDSAHGSTVVNGSTNSEKFFSHDRASASPHDPPPAKRHKTSHRASSSTASINKDITSVLSRKRANSVAVNMGSPTKNPVSPIVNGHQEQYTQDFMRLYDKDYTQTRHNSYLTLAISNDLSTWLNDIEQFQAVTNGKTQNNVLKRWDQPWENLEQASPGYTVRKDEDESMLIHGRHPIFYYVIANNVAMPGSYIGEINGQIGRTIDYKQHPDSKWDTLLHPEPFVYFHADLPIYIDARSEGSELRFVRRSCHPNSKIEIIIVGQAYHFCLVTDKEINTGDEITISWTFEGRFTSLMGRIWEKKPIQADDAEYIKTYLSGLKANFGGCACDESQGPCLLEKMLETRAVKELNFQPPKPPRRKGRKGMNHISPLSTGAATNSRAGSEAVNGMDIDDDAMDSRSASGSARGHSSRDITPAIATDAPVVGLGVGLTAREQRKLEQAERMFEKLEKEGGKKRNSAGSTLNTPNISTSVSQMHLVTHLMLTYHQKRLGHDTSPNPSPTSSTNAGKSAHTRQPRRSMPNGVTSHSRQSKPVYADMTTQTEEPLAADIVDMEIVDRRRQRGCSFALKLLRRARKSQSQPGSKEGTPSPSRTVSPSSQLLNRTSNASGTQTDASKAMPPPPPPAHSKTPQSTSPVLPREEVTESADVEMKDVETSPQPLSESAEIIKDQPVEETITPIVTPTIPAQPPTPSPTIEQKEGSPNMSVGTPVTKPVLHVPLPLPTFSIKTQLFSPVSAPSTPQTNGLSTATTTPAHPGALFSPTLHSPTTVMSNAPLMSPSLTHSGAAPSPVKKKLSLSDYSNRNKKKVQEAAAQAAQSSPLATSAPLSLKGISEESADGPEKENLPVNSNERTNSITGQMTTDEPMQVDSKSAPSAEMEIDSKEEQPANVT